MASEHQFNLLGKTHWENENALYKINYYHFSSY